MGENLGPNKILEIERILYFLISINDHEIDQLMAKIIFAESMDQYREYIRDRKNDIAVSKTVYDNFYDQRDSFDGFLVTDTWKS